jgi:hypothetical protein
METRMQGARQSQAAPPGCWTFLHRLSRRQWVYTTARTGRGVLVSTCTCTCTCTRAFSSGQDSLFVHLQYPHSSPLQKTTKTASLQWIECSTHLLRADCMLACALLDTPCCLPVCTRAKGCEAHASCSSVWCAVQEKQEQPSTPWDLLCRDCVTAAAQEQSWQRPPTCGTSTPRRACMHELPCMHAFMAAPDMQRRQSAQHAAGHKAGVCCCGTAVKKKHKSLWRYLQPHPLLPQTLPSAASCVCGNSHCQPPARRPQGNTRACRTGNAGNRAPCSPCRAQCQTGIAGGTRTSHQQQQQQQQGGTPAVTTDPQPGLQPSS